MPNADGPNAAESVSGAPVSFDRLAHAYDGTRGLPPEVEWRVVEAIVELTGATPETSFVEPGIGTGRIALALVRCGYRYAGMDVSEKMLAELRRKLADVPGGASGWLRLFRADTTALPFEDDSFDVAVSAHMLHLILSWRKVLAEVRRVLIYCHQEWDESCSRAAFLERRREILVPQGVDTSAPGASKPEVLRALREENAILEPHIATRWQDTITVEDTLGRYADRLYSTEWRLPDALFEVPLGELRSWAADQYPSPKTMLDDAVSFEITAAHGWSDGKFEA